LKRDDEQLSSNFHGVCLVRVYSLPFRGSIRPSNTET
jgi:hypothetical protein